MLPLKGRLHCFTHFTHSHKTIFSIHTITLPVSVKTNTLPISVDHFDRPLVTSPWAPILPLVFATLAIRHYPGEPASFLLTQLIMMRNASVMLNLNPGSDRWTPARGDTTASIGVSI